MSVKSNETGRHVFVNVQPGTYIVVAEQAGFKTAVLPAFTVGGMLPSLSGFGGKFCTQKNRPRHRVREGDQDSQVL